MRDEEREHALARLEALGLVQGGPCGRRATRRWQAAMARAALRLMRAGDPGEDLRVPVAAALVELCGEETAAEQIAAMVEAMLPIEAGGVEAGRAERAER